MKHSDIIENLDLLQKVALVSSGLDGEALAQAGVPSAGRTELNGLAAARGVSYASAARSWDGALVGKMTEELAAEAGESGARLFVTPDLKVALDPAGAGLAEDGFLSGALGAAIVHGVHAAGGAVGLARPSLAKEDLRCLDLQEEQGAVHALAVRPFLNAVKEEGAEAVILSPARAGGGYPGTNRAIFRDALNGVFGKEAFVVGEQVPAGEAVSYLQRGTSLGGARLSVERAAMRYRQLSGYLAEGSVSQRDLDDAVRDGSALPVGLLDEAADETVDFCMRISEREIAEPMGEDARRELAAASVVLLKNEKILPLEAGAKVAVIGEAYADLSALSARFTVAAQAKGYEGSEERSDALLPEAVRAAGAADVVLLFLTPGGGSSLSLPANRMALLTALKKTGKPIVALVCGDRTVDMSFDGSAAACLLLPPDGPFACDALARILSGEVSPSGRLTRTAYDDADGAFRALAADRDSGRFRMGAFFGYLRYDTAGETVRYPFGYGLGYTKFTYSGLSVSDSEVSFTLKNTGKRDGWEVAQVYVGAPSLSRVMPKKELRAFCRVFLRAGESKKVTLPLPREAYATFDDATLSDTVERGTYRIYVGASALDIRLTGKRTVEGVVREKGKDRMTDYFRGEFDSADDVEEEGRIGTEARPPKRLRIARKIALCLMPALAALFFLFLTVLIVSYSLDFALIETIDEETAEWVLYGIAVVVLALTPLLGSLNRKRLSTVRTGALLLCPVLLFACLIFGFLLLEGGEEEAERIALIAISCFAIGVPMAAIVAALTERELRRSKSGANRWAKYYFEEEKKETFTEDAAFEEAFLAAQAAEAKSAPRVKEESAPAEIPHFYDSHLTYAVLLGDCRRFAQERGVLVEEDVLACYLAALSSSGLVVLPAGGGVRLAETVAEYFGKRAFIDNAAECTRPEDLFFRWKEAERRNVETPFTEAIRAAGKERAYLFTALFRHVDPPSLERIFGPLAEVLARKKTSVRLSDRDVALPPNLCIVLELQTEDPVLPASIAEVASLVAPAVEEGEPAGKKTIVQAVGAERFFDLRRTVRDRFPLSEASWKRIDALDEKCRAAHIGNLLWNKTELHASVAAACGENEADALRHALRAELLPWIEATWDEEVCGDLEVALTEAFGTATEREKPKGGRKKR